MNERAKAEEALRRIEEHITALESLPETRPRDVARELLEAVLDFHGITLARMTGVIAMSGHGDAIFGSMAADEYIAAALLLHGLHPETPETRIRRAMKMLAPMVRTQGGDIYLTEVSSGVARFKLRMPGASRDEVTLLRRQIEEAIVEAAPDLEEIAILNDVGNAEPVHAEPLAAAS
jgi:hypothetical protein